ncbi:MAG: metal-sensing transcriptional repressor [Patescibacteria group bacterium]|nr:metal-sensing transcriptional repressor [Patescibacteria group bacterium]
MVKKIDQKAKILIGLKKARTSLDKIVRELEDEKSSTDKKCFDVIQQNLSVIGLLKSANVAMLENHLDMYIDNTGNGKKQKNELQKMKEEIVKIVQTAQKK